MKKFIICIGLCVFSVIKIYSQQIGNGVATSTNFNLPLFSGGYQAVGAQPNFLDDSHPWKHLLVIRHATLENNHQMQIASSFTTNDRLFFRKVGETYAPWNEVATRGANTFTGNQHVNGNVGIGTDAPTELLDVRGKIRANEIIVNTLGADFVFADDYRLRPLQEVEQFITENKHLPDIASAESMAENGVGVSELQTKLLQKVEELTLYVIAQEKKMNQQQESQMQQIEALKQELEEMKCNSLNIIK